MTDAAAITALLALLFRGAPPAGEAQKTPPAVSLPRALAAFGSADSNGDGRISPEEARTIPVSASLFTAEDEDKDGFWSREEFLVFYRHQLIAGGQPVGSDLEGEIARVQALRRVHAAEETKKLTAETSARCTDPGSLGARFSSALADLEKKCASRKATADDFQRLRNLVILSGRVPQRAGNEAPSATAQAAMIESLDRIQKRAASGQPVADEFQTLRQRAAPACAPAAPPAPAENPRAEPSKNPAPAAKPAPTPSSGGPADARQRSQRPPPKPQERPTPDRKDKDDPGRGKP